VPSMAWMQDKKWLVLGIIAIAVFIDFVRMHMEKFLGWRLLILCFLVVSPLALAATWGRQRARFYWSQATGKTRTILVLSAIAIALFVIFLTNRHKPEEGIDDVVGVLGILFVLALLAVKNLFFRLMDALHARFAGR
jgi:phosphatidylglycerophosphate synthase